MIDHISLLKKLISFQSITPDDGGAMDYISLLLKENGFQVYIQEFGPERVKNLYAVKGSKSPNICFAGHIDVVPPGEGWTSDPFVAREEDGKIFGRGAVDMKGALSCMIAAAANLDFNHSEKSISLLITADEEGDAFYGTKAMLEWMEQNGHKIDFAVVGEPTCEKKLGDTIKVGRRGSVNFKLKVSGTQGHVAYPQLADNPNTIMTKILYELSSLKLDEGNQSFQPSNLEITSIDTNNPVTNVIPKDSNARINVRFNNEHNSQDIINNIDAICAKYSSHYLLEHRVSAEPFISKDSEFRDIFYRVVEKEVGFLSKFSTSGGTSDARFIQNYCPLLEFGLLNETAHKIDEHVEIGDLQKLYNVYYCFLSVI